MCRVEDLNPKKAVLVGVEDLDSLTYEQRVDVAKRYLRLRAVEVVQAAMKPFAAN